MGLRIKSIQYWSAWKAQFKGAAYPLCLSPRSWAALATRQLTSGTSGPRLRSCDWGLLVRAEPGFSPCVCVCLWSQWTGWKTAEWRWNMTKLLVLLSLLIPGNWLHYVLLQLLLKSCKVTQEGMPKVLVCLFFWSPSPHCGLPDKYGTAVPFLRNDFYSFKTSLSNFFFLGWGGMIVSFPRCFVLLCFLIFQASAPFAP